MTKEKLILCAVLAAHDANRVAVKMRKSGAPDSYVQQCLLLRASSMAEARRLKT